MASDNDHKAANAVDKHKKSWGHEEWIVNNELYCGKKLVFLKAHGATSLHFHIKKHETMYCLKGRFKITSVDTKTGVPRDFTLSPGESLVIVPMDVHRITALDDNSELIEFSTHHEDSDSYRVQK